MNPIDSPKKTPPKSVNAKPSASKTRFAPDDLDPDLLAAAMRGRIVQTLPALDETHPISELTLTRPSVNSISTPQATHLVHAPISLSTTEILGPDLYQNRELSWLAFNQRVIEEAENPRQPCWSA